MMTKTQYYILSFTWGLVMTLIGCIVSIVLLICGKKPQKWLYGYYFVVGERWGGVSFGPFSVVSENPTTHTLNHEFGHSIQNCILGLFMPFLVAIPSAIRYWYREYLMRIKGKTYWDLPAYDSIWFEGSATKIGEAYYKALNHWLF